MQNIRTVLCVGAVFGLFGCFYAGAGEEKGANVAYRVNCGAAEEYVDPRGVRWSADQLLEPGKTWGAVGGGTVAREKALPVYDDVAPELYRTERFGAKAYEFDLPNGVYAVRLHFAEMHATNFKPGKRVFDIALTSGLSLMDFDPIQEAGAFATPAVMEFSGVEVTGGKLRVQFTQKIESVAINAIEILKTGPAERKICNIKPVRRGLASERVAPPEGSKPAKVLFIGNSLTGWWALPETLQDMINSTPGKLRITADGAIIGGANLQRHYTASDALRRIRDGRYDYVVLQDYAALQDGKKYSKEQGLEYAAKFDKAVREAGGRTLIYGTWTPSIVPIETQDALTQVQWELARELNANFVPVGSAWQTVRRERPELTLHNTDKVHPGIHGAYLRDCVFYAVLTGQSPVGIPFRTVLGREVEIEPDIAAYLQEVAWKTVQRHRLPEVGPK